MPELGLDTAVGQWVAEWPGTARVLESLQIDYCCGGDRSLSQACAERQMDPQHVLDRLRASIAESTSVPDERWTEKTLDELCDHIEATHHQYLRSELPRLALLIDKVCSVHGAAHPELADMRRAFAALQAELAPHMFKEEQILFPAIRQLERSAQTPAFPFGSVANPVRMMEHEHDNAGAALAEIRRATGDYRLPPDACSTYGAMLDGLRTLELDMHQHVHKENNILFPRAMARERQLSGGLV